MGGKKGDFDCIKQNSHGYVWELSDQSDCGYYSGNMLWGCRKDQIFCFKHQEKTIGEKINTWQVVKMPSQR